MTRILVAEDSPVNMALLTDILEMNGHEVLEAKNGLEALKVAKAEKPDLILLDMMMPIMDGFEAAAKLKADDATKGIPIVGLTALAMEGDERRVREAGCDAYVTKPIDTRALPAMLDAMLGRGSDHAVPSQLLTALDGELAQGAEVFRGALEVLNRRANDHAAMRQLEQWAHRLRGAALTLEMADLAAVLGRMEATARQADAEGRADAHALEALRAHLKQVVALHAKLRGEQRST